MIVMGPVLVVFTVTRKVRRECKIQNCFSQLWSRYVEHNLVQSRALTTARVAFVRLLGLGPFYP